MRSGIDSLLAMRKIIVITFIIFCIAGDVFATPVQSGSRGTMQKVKGKVQRHFDRDEDGYLSRYELALYQTHLLFGYPLAKKKKQIPYDFNQDFMLQPYEMKQYLKDKKEDNLKKLAEQSR